MHLKIAALFLLAVCSPTLQASDKQLSQVLPRVKEPAIPHRTAKVTEFGAVPDGRTVNTAAIARGIAALAEKGGGKLVFPSGIWLTGPIALKSKIELHLEEGALLQFVQDVTAYPVLNVNLRKLEQKICTAPIQGDSLEDVAITGRGVVDGGGEAWRPVKHSKLTEGQWKQLCKSGGVVEGRDGNEMWWPSPTAKTTPRPRLVRLLNCKRVLLDGPTFQNSPGWNLNPVLSEDVTIRNVFVRNPWNAQNGDGLDLEYCRNVVIRDSRFDVGDDAICLKSGAGEKGRRVGVPTENVLVENCVVYHGHGGVTIGSEMSSGVRNVHVNNCTFIGTDLGLRFKSTRGRGGVVEKIYINNVRMIDIVTDAIGFNMYYAGRSPAEEEPASGDTNAPSVNDGTPQFRDIHISNVTCRGAGRAVALQGLPEMPIRGIHLSHISITSKQGIDCADAGNIILDHVEIHNTTGPVVSLTNARDVQIDSLIYPSLTPVVIRAKGGQNSGIVIKNTGLKPAGQDVELIEGASRTAFEVK